MMIEAALKLTYATIDCVGAYIGSMAFVFQRTICPMERDAASAPRRHQQEESFLGEQKEFARA